MAKLFHFTKCDSFINILKSKTFWLNDSTMMKDSTDRTFGATYLKKVIAEANEEQTPYLYKLKKKNVLKTESFTMWPMYIMCFCRQNNLHLWEQFADKERGLAFEVDISYMQNKLKSQFESRLGQVKEKGFRGESNFFKVENVRYDNEENLLAWIEHVCKYFNISAKRSERDILALLQAMTSGLIKGGTFSIEAETRLYYFETETPTLLVENDKSPLQRALYSSQYEQYKSALEHYTKRISRVELKLDEIWGSELIPRVILGRDCAWTVEEMREKLGKNKLSNTRIERMD